ncbi:aspartate/glutamate racemase family protein [Arsenicitalea aurantiaca]|uniref:aspartate/glutamate racemase family protein n=1 Tax=Arsenicitalea aurantiaca TaxID=1783274 RepID=UPI00131506E8|nr:aspartate/glutamate racemase family protein [Arsenicitalea aurantiaca]
MRICFLGTQERLDYLRGFASPGVELDNMADFKGKASRPVSIESRVEEIELAGWIIERTIEAEKRGFDAVITGCFGDPGVDAAREMVRIPVIAPGEAALLTARMLSHHFSIISPLPGTVPIAREQTHKIGVSPYVASIRGFGVPVERIRDRDPKTIDDLVALGRKCVEEDGAELIVFACASMSLLTDMVEPRIGVTCINSVRLSLKTAEMLVGAGLRHSAVTFPTPAKLAHGVAA